MIAPGVTYVHFIARGAVNQCRIVGMLPVTLPVRFHCTSGGSKANWPESHRKNFWVSGTNSGPFRCLRSSNLRDESPWGHSNVKSLRHSGEHRQNLGNRVKAARRRQLVDSRTLIIVYNVALFLEVQQTEVTLDGRSSGITKVRRPRRV